MIRSVKASCASVVSIRVSIRFLRRISDPARRRFSLSRYTWVPALRFSLMVAAAAFGAPEPENAFAQPEDAAPVAARPSAASGLEIYAENCIRCHGPYGRGEGELRDQLPAPPPSFASTAGIRRTTPEEAFTIVTEGRIERVMPPWKDALSESERWDVVYGAWSFYFTPTRMARAEVVWQESCASCHGPNGAGVEGKEIGTLSDADWLATKSGVDLLGAYRENTAHSELDITNDLPTLWSAIDRVRAFGFDPLPFDELEANGVLSGVVVNRTEGADEVAGTIVRAAPLGVPIPGEIISTTVESDGSFVMDGLIVGPGVEHRVAAMFGGVEFVSTLRPTGASAEAESPLELAVHESSSSVPITVSALHAVLAPAPSRGMIEVVERWSLGNGSDRARVPDSEENPSATLALFAGAMDVQVHDGAEVGSVVRVGDSMLDYRPIPPGGREVVLIYDIPYSDSTVSVVRRLDLPVQVHTLTVASEDIVIDGAWAQSKEQIELMGRAVEQLVGGPLEAGVSFEARLEGVVAPSASSAQTPGAISGAPQRVITQRTLSRIGLLGLTLAVLIAGIYPLAERRSNVRKKKQRLSRQRDKVMAALEDLERRNAAGEVAPRDYGARRAALMERAIAVERRVTPLADQQVTVIDQEPEASE